MNLNILATLNQSPSKPNVEPYESMLFYFQFHSDSVSEKNKDLN